ncbi:MAG: alpha/beta hydrolase, partial [Burkholderiales bacterium]|nr:alpha/beta hydrolase [Burkholderiales bacterium]
LSEFGGISQMRDMAGALVAQGIAVWNVEYRRNDEQGGGFPGVYQDIDAALALLAEHADRHRLDLGHLLAMGHSAGGHLVRWVAGRDRLPANSPLRNGAIALPVNKIISLGTAGGNLRTEGERLKQFCGLDVVKLTGQASAERPDVHADTNPSQLLPNGSHSVLINGELDRLSPPSLALEHAELMRQAGDSVETLVLPGASHFDEVATRSPAWQLILPVIRRLLGLPASK